MNKQWLTILLVLGASSTVSAGWFDNFMQGLQGTTQLAMTGAIASTHLKHNVKSISKDVRDTGDSLTGNATAVLEGGEGAEGGFFSKLEQVSADFQEGVNNSLSQGSDAVASGLDDHITRHREGLVSDLDTAVTGQREATFSELDRQRVDSLDRADDTITRNISDTTDKMELDGLSEGVQNIGAGTLAVGVSAVSVADSASQVPVVIDENMQEANDTLAQAAADMNAIMETNLKSLDENGNKLIETIDASGNRVTSAIDAQGNALTETIDANGNRLYHQGEELVFAVDQQGNNISDSIDQSGDQLSDSIGTAGASTSAAITAGAVLTDEQLRAQGRAAREQLAATAEARLFAKEITISSDLDRIVFGLELFEPGAALAKYASDKMLRDGVNVTITELNSVKSTQLAEMTDTQFDEYVLRKKSLDYAQFKLSGTRLEIVKIFYEVDEGVYSLFLTPEEQSEVAEIRATFAAQLEESVQISIGKLNAAEFQALRLHITGEAEAIVDASVQRNTSEVVSVVDAVEAEVDAMSDAIEADIAVGVQSLDEVQQQMEADAQRQTNIALAQQKLAQLQLDAEDLKIVIRSGDSGGAKIKVRHILIAADRTGGEALAQSLHTELTENPAFFPARARTHSDDLVTKNTGGIRNYFLRGTYDAGFEGAAFVLTQTNQFAPLTKTTLGYEIIQLLDRQSTGVASSTDDKVLAFNDRADALIADLAGLGLLEDKATVENLKAQVQTEVNKKAPVRSNVGVDGLF